ncbi:MAG: DUF4846 domain-containing protein [Niabella sp.]
MPSISQKPANNKVTHAITFSENCIEQIPLPDGYKRAEHKDNSFASYIGRIGLKLDKTVYLYNGIPKANQLAQYAVLNISVGDKDLQQCADAVMRLRAEYLYEQKMWNQIEFYNGKKEKIKYINWLGTKQNTRGNFMKYMEYVFSYCGTASLPYSVINKPFEQMKIGDILLKPGFPGHTVIVVDMAENNYGKKVYLLAQSYMPAQDIHVLKNPENTGLSPWYELNEEEKINTPEWVFYNTQLYEWK